MNKIILYLLVLSQIFKQYNSYKQQPEYVTCSVNYNSYTTCYFNSKISGYRGAYINYKISASGPVFCSGLGFGFYQKGSTCNWQYWVNNKIIVQDYFSLIWDSPNAIPSISCYGVNRAENINWDIEISQGNLTCSRTDISIEFSNPSSKRNTMNY